MPRRHYTKRPPEVSTPAGSGPQPIRMRLTELTEIKRLGFGVIESEPRTDQEDSVLISGSATDLLWVCASCGSALIDGVQANQLQGVAVQCPVCRAHNIADETGATPTPRRAA